MASPFGPTFQSRRAVAGPVLRNGRLRFLATVALAGFILWSALQEGSGRLDALLATPFPWLLGAYLLYALGEIVVLEVEARRPAPSWTVTDAGLVRTRGLEVRTLPWRRFRSVRTRATSDGHGDVWLHRRNLLAFKPWMRAREGRVWLPGNALCIPDVERAGELESAIRRRIL